MRVIHVGRRDIAVFEPPEPCIVISVVDPHSGPAHVPTNERIRAVHRVEPFHDLDQEMIEGIDVVKEGYVLFDHSRARLLAEFVHQWPGIPLIVAQCEAGISRSAGIAAAIQTHFRLSGQSAFTTGIPNRFVFRLLLEALHEQA